MKKLGDIMAGTGKYMKDGQEKTSWTKCGTLFEKEPGKYTVKWDATPAGNQWEGWCPVFEDKPKQGQTPSVVHTESSNDAPFDDDIPF